MATKRICMTCGKEYEYCPTCGKQKNEPKWKYAWDTEECKNVYDALTLYNMKKMDEKTFAYKMEGKNIKKFTDKIQKEINVILQKRKKQEVTKTPEWKSN